MAQKVPSVPCRKLVGNWCWRQIFAETVCGIIGQEKLESQHAFLHRGRTETLKRLCPWHCGNMIWPHRRNKLPQCGGEDLAEKLWQTLSASAWTHHLYAADHHSSRTGRSDSSDNALRSIHKMVEPHTHAPGLSQVQLIWRLAMFCGITKPKNTLIKVKIQGIGWCITTPSKNLGQYLPKVFHHHQPHCLGYLNCRWPWVAPPRQLEPEKLIWGNNQGCSDCSLGLQLPQICHPRSAWFQSGNFIGGAYKIYKDFSIQGINDESGGGCRKILQRWYQASRCALIWNSLTGVSWYGVETEFHLLFWWRLSNKSCQFQHNLWSSMRFQSKW